jgi:Tfp pilus assembly protein PilX
MGTLIKGRRVGPRQGGFSLLMTLLSLLILTLSSMAMMAMLKAGVTTSGNIAFRQAAVRAGDVAVEDAVTWLSSQGSEYLKDTHIDQGYYASNDPAFNPATYDFANVGMARSHGSAVSGYTLYYVIHRMATTSGLTCTDNAGCLYPPIVTAAETGQGTSRSGGGGYSAGISGATGAVYYRVTVKIVGPRYNNRFVQAFLY